MVVRERKSRCLTEELCWMEVLFAEAAETGRGVVWGKVGDDASIAECDVGPAVGCPQELAI